MSTNEIKTATKMDPLFALEREIATLKMDIHIIKQDLHAIDDTRFKINCFVNDEKDKLMKLNRKQIKIEEKRTAFDEEIAHLMAERHLLNKTSLGISKKLQLSWVSFLEMYENDEEEGHPAAEEKPAAEREASTGRESGGEEEPDFEDELSLIKTEPNSNDGTSPLQTTPQGRTFIDNACLQRAIRPLKAPKRLQRSVKKPKPLPEPTRLKKSEIDSGRLEKARNSPTFNVSDLPTH